MVAVFVASIFLANTEGPISSDVINVLAAYGNFTTAIMTHIFDLPQGDRTIGLMMVVGQIIWLAVLINSIVRQSAPNLSSR